MTEEIKRLSLNFQTEDYPFETDAEKNERQKHEMMNKFVDEFNFTKFTTNETTSPGTLLGRAIKNTGYTARQFAEKTGIKAPSLYHHVGGGREISQETAIKYAEKLNCDPVDLMFEKKS